MKRSGLKIALLPAILFACIFVCTGIATTAQAATPYINPGCSTRCIGIGYDNFQPDGGNPIAGIMGAWTSQGAWATPVLGDYNSDDPVVMDKHAEWLTDMGVDFITDDWTNSAANVLAGAIAVDQIEKKNTDDLFAEYQKLSLAGKPYPRIALILGPQDEGTITQTQIISSGVLDAEANYVYTNYVLKYPNIYYSLNGKPLLLIYTGIPTATGSIYDPVPSKWNDSNLGRFTLRNMTVYDIPHLGGNTLTSTPVWSWIDSDPWPSDTGNPPEEETVTQAYPGCPPWENYIDPCTDTTPDGVPIEAGRDGTTNNSSLNQNTDNSVTFRKQWAKALSNDPKIIYLNQWDEWDTTDVISPNFSNDLEPSQVLGCGPMTVVQQAVAAWKGITLPAINCNPPTGFVVKTVPKMTITASKSTISIGQTDVIAATFTAGPGDAFVSGYGADIDELPPNGAWKSVTYQHTAPFSPVTYSFTPTAPGAYEFAPYSYTNYYPSGGTIQPITVIVSPPTPPAAPTFAISADKTALTVGQSTTIRATATLGSGDSLSGLGINEVPPNGVEIIAQNLLNQNPVTYTFTPTTAGTYYFLPGGTTSQYPGLIQSPFAQWVTVTVTAATTPSIQIPAAATITTPTVSLTQSLTITTETNGVGNPFTLSWTSTNATACTVQQQTPSGIIVNPWATGTTGNYKPAPGGIGTDHYWIDCNGAGGTVHQDVYHTVTAASASTTT